MFRTVPLPIIRNFSLYTQQWYMCWQLASRIRTERPDPARKLSAHIPLLRVQWKIPDDGQRNCPKHVELYSKNKFEELVHLVGFITRIYHDARSPERQIQINPLLVLWVWNCLLQEGRKIKVYRFFGNRMLRSNLDPRQKRQQHSRVNCEG